MRFPPQYLDDLRARLPVSEVVRRRVQLKKAGREWRGLSPFNKERTPSFFVNDDKAMWFDFSSGKNGNIFDFVMQTEGVAFPEAVERLAGMAGLPLPQVSPEADAREERRRTLHDVAELAAQFFEQTLAARTGAKARGYLADRGIAPATQLQFRLGYAPAERFALKEFLGNKGVPVVDMVEAGLLVSGDDIPVAFDRFRDRVTFPIADARGRVIAFGGRALEKDVPAKYLNSPETSLFHKGATLYNLAAARSAAHQGAPLIAVEGYVDVIAMVSAGFSGTVAPLGTALTEEQLALLWRMTDEPLLCFDGDGAGRRAAYRAVDLALPALKPGKSLKFATLPQGQDPDDLLRAGGRGAMEDVLAGARPLADLLWLRETEAGGFDTPERRAALEARLDAIIRVIGQDAVRKYYRQDFQVRLQGLFAPVSRKPVFTGRGFAGYASSPGRGYPGAGHDRRPRFADRGRNGVGDARAQGPYMAVSPQLAASSVLRGHLAAIPRREVLILQIVSNHPWLLQDHLEDFSRIEFRHGDTQKLKGAVIDIVAHDAGADWSRLRAEIAARGLEPLMQRVERIITTVSVWGARPEAAPDDVLMTWKQLVTLHRQWHSLTKELKDAERALGQEGSEANYSWLCDVKARLSDIEGTEALIEGFGVSSGRTVGNV
ncbi:MAG: DNA primase [Rhizobiales bacterium]|nr:DNA primase [Hyphomicrobiales bacterium]